MKLRVLGLSVDSHAATSHVACTAQMGIVQNAPICVSSERFFTLSESVPRFTLRFYFSEVHNYKNCLQPQLPTHKCTSRHLGKQ